MQTVLSVKQNILYEAFNTLRIYQRNMQTDDRSLYIEIYIQNFDSFLTLPRKLKITFKKIYMYMKITIRKQFTNKLRNQQI